MSTQQGPAAGWYDDPQMVNTRRYWDGEQWTDNRQEKAAAAPAVVVAQAEEPSSAVVLAGVLLAILFPIVGLLIGLSIIGKRGNAGITIVVLSVAAFVMWYYALTS